VATVLRQADLAASVALAGKSGVAPTRPDVQLVRVSLNTILANASPAGDLTCYSDPGTGLVVGWAQGSVTTCAATGTPTVVPTSTGTVTGLKVRVKGGVARACVRVCGGLAWANTLLTQRIAPTPFFFNKPQASLTKTGDLARLIFEVTPTSSPYPAYYYCGTALGTLPRELLPSRFGLAGLGGTCGAAGRRRLTAAATVDPAQTVVVAAPIDPAQGPPKAGFKLVYTPAELETLVIKWRAAGAPPPPPPPAPRQWGFGNTGLDAYAVAYGNLGMTLLAQLVEDPGTISVRWAGVEVVVVCEPARDGTAGPRLPSNLLALPLKPLAPP